MIHFFPGLFCNQKIWDPYLGLGDHCSHALKEAQSVHLKIKPSDTLIGYSMGGRVALQVAKKLNFNIKRLILLSSHPGIPDSEKIQRKIWEDEVIHKMRHLNTDEFFEYWDSLSIFSNTQSDKTMSDTVFKEYVELFENNRLSQQTNYLDDLIRNREKILYVYGSKDEKYSLLGRHLKGLGVNSIQLESDHRVHLASDQLFSILKKEISK